MTDLGQCRATLAQASDLLDKAQRLLVKMMTICDGLRKEGYL